MNHFDEASECWNKNVFARVIRNFVYQTFPAAAQRQISDEDSLIESGIVDSLGVLDLVTFLEASFELILEDDDVVGGHFESIQSLTTFIAQRNSSPVQG